MSCATACRRIHAFINAWNRWKKQPDVLDAANSVEAFLDFGWQTRQHIQIVFVLLPPRPGQVELHVDEVGEGIRHCYSLYRLHFAQNQLNGSAPLH